MALSDRDPRNVKKGPPCAACLLEGRMTQEDRDTLAAWMDDPAITTSTILSALTDEGYAPPSEPSLARHRARRCWGRRGAV